MIDSVGVRINDVGKIIFVDINNLELENGLAVIVEFDKGLQYATVVDFFKKNENSVTGKVIRIATKKDYLQYLKNQELAEKALVDCKKMVQKNKLNMSIIDAVYSFDRNQLVFRFLSDERVDFRQLAKTLGAKLKTRIELRQIGVRDKAKEIGGIGPCGRQLCCSTFLTSFSTVSINMAKNQGLALNPSKINGVCGRLLCCLNYENEEYTKIKKNISEVGKKTNVKNKEGKAVVDKEMMEVDINDSKK